MFCFQVLDEITSLDHSVHLLAQLNLLINDFNFVIFRTKYFLHELESLIHGKDQFLVFSIPRRQQPYFLDKLNVLELVDDGDMTKMRGIECPSIKSHIDNIFHQNNKFFFMGILRISCIWGLQNENDDDQKFISSEDESDDNSAVDCIRNCIFSFFFFNNSLSLISSVTLNLDIVPM